VNPLFPPQVASVVVFARTSVANNAARNSGREVRILSAVNGMSDKNTSSQRTQKNDHKQNQRLQDEDAKYRGIAIQFVLSSKNEVLTLMFGVGEVLSTGGS
jgi:hypothetical protein